MDPRLIVDNACTHRSGDAVKRRPQGQRAIAAIHDQLEDINQATTCSEWAKDTDMTLVTTKRRRDPFGTSR